MSPTHAFLILAGILALTVISAAVAYWLLRRADRAIAEHQEEYWR
jgi:cbb3-type cytochrome oxidase subunit 3